MSKSRKLHDLTTEQETNTSTVQPRTTEEEQENSDGYEIEEIQYYITLSEFPGGSEKFETLAKFCNVHGIFRFVVDKKVRFFLSKKKKKKFRFKFLQKLAFRFFFFLKFLVIYVLRQERHKRIVKNTNLSIFLTKMGNERQTEVTEVDKVLIFISQADKVFFGQTTDEKSKISPKYNDSSTFFFFF